MLPSDALFGCQVHYRAAVGSTNDEARRLAQAGAPEGTLVIADEQHAGRGRLNRLWWSPPNSSLLLSLLLRPPVSLQQSQHLTMCAGLGATDAIEQITGLSVGLKWPNDLLINGKKMGGILTEVESAEGQVNFAIVGLGLNINMDAGTLLSLDAPATSLSAEVGYSVDRLALLTALLRHWEDRYRRWLRGESPREAWAARLVTLGRRVRVTVGNETWEGKAVGVNEEGALLLRQDDGTVKTLWAGDVTLREG